MKVLTTVLYFLQITIRHNDFSAQGTALCSSAQTPQHQQGCNCLCVSMRAILNLQICQGSNLFGLPFAILKCPRIFNMHKGPPSLSPLSEKARHLIHYARARGKCIYFPLVISLHIFNIQFHFTSTFNSTSLHIFNIQFHFTYSNIQFHFTSHIQHSITFQISLHIFKIQFHFTFYSSRSENPSSQCCGKKKLVCLHQCQTPYPLIYKKKQ